MEKKFILFFFIISCVILIAISTFNFIIDYEKIFYKKSYFLSNIQKNFNEKKIIYYNINGNSRIIKRYYFEQYNDNLDILLCGQSKTMNINSSLFKNKKFLNISVPGGSMYDLNTLCLDAYNKLKPKIVIINADITLFIKNIYILENNINHEPKSAGSDDFKKKLSDSNFFLLLSYHNTIQNFKEISYKSKKKKKKLLSSPQYLEFYYDGSTDLYKNAKNKYDLNMHNKAIRSYFNTETNKLLYSKINDDLFSQFSNLLKYFSKNSKVFILEVPYYSIWYDLSYLNNKNYLIIENRLENLPKEINNVNIIGSFHNKTAGCEDKDYPDWGHPDLNCFNKIFSNF